MSDRVRFSITVDWDEEADKAECSLVCRPNIMPRDSLNIAAAFLMAYAATRSSDGYEAGLDMLRELAMKARIDRGKA